MRTVFTTEDVKNIIQSLFMENDEPITLIEDDGTRSDSTLVNYLNIRFYNWKNRVIEKGQSTATGEYFMFDDWVQSLNFSLNESYALVEKIDEEVTASQDIDNAVITGKITFLVQSDKIKNLDYFVSKIRNVYLGNPQDIQNNFGEILKAYILLGTLTYDEEPFATQYGECVIVSSYFKLEYLTEALTYADTKIEISLTGDDLYDKNGNIVDGDGEPTTTKYKTMPLTNATMQNLFTTNAVPTSARPDLTGFLATSLSTAKAFTFYDFNKELTNAFNDLFWSVSAIIKDGAVQAVRDVNIPVYIRITCGGHFYVYKDMLESMQKNITNNTFNTSTITLKGWGKLS